MKLHALLGLVLGLASQTSASDSAAPWQMVMWYYAYRLHTDLGGVNQQTFAPCVSNGQVCSFDEFVRNIQRANPAQWPAGGTTGVDALGLWDPTPDAAVQQIRNNIGQDVYNLPTAQEKIFPTVGKTPRLPYANQIYNANYMVWQLRSWVKTTYGAQLSDYDSTKLHFSYFDEATKGVQEMRRYDLWQYQIGNVYNHLIQKGYDTQKTRVYASSDTSYNWYEIDTAYTLANNPGVTAATLQADITAGFDQTAGSHPTVIQQLDQLISANASPC